VHTYQCPALTVKHILVECTDLNDNRTKYLVTYSLEELFRTVDVYVTSLILSKKLILQQAIMLIIFFIVAIALIISQF